jgi:hypothetical protein
MAAKRIRISDDAGANYYTFPGSTGDMRRELASVNDTIFGQNFQSNQPSIGNWQVTCNSFFKGVAGYIAQLKVGGTPVVMTAEPTTLVSGKTYQITNAAKRIISYLAAVTVKDAGVDRTANVQSIDYLNGTVTFLAAYTVTGAVTIDGQYVPTAAAGRARSFTLTQTAAEIDTTDYATATANGGWRTYDPGLCTTRLELRGVYDSTQGLQAALASRAIVYVDVAPANDTNTIFRGFFKRTTFGQSGDVGALEDSTTTLDLWVPDGSLVERPFGWYLSASTTLNLAVRKALAAWQGQTKPLIQYLPDGTNGFGGSAIVTEATLANTFDGQNEFRFTFRGDGTPNLVP